MPSSFAFPGRVDESIERPFPSWATLAGGAVGDPLFNNTALGQFCTSNQLGKALEARTQAERGGFHSSVHGDVGGVFQGLLSPQDPIFWAYHKRIDRAYHEWLGSNHLQCIEHEVGQLDELLRGAFALLTPADHADLEAFLRAESHAFGHH